MRIGPVICAVSAAILLLGCGGASPSSLEFVDITPAEPRLGEITTVRFKAMDSRGQPMAGVLVNFSLADNQPGVSFASGIREGTTNKGDGIVSTQIVATSRVSSVIVKAEVPPAIEMVASSPPITFAGSVPNARQFTFQCGSIAGTASGGVHAIGAYDETRYLIAGVKVECFAHVADRNGDGVPNALVSFMAEAGTLGPTDTSVADVVGNARTLYKTSYPLPVDVAPGAFSWNPPKDSTHTGEYIAPLWMHPFIWISNPITQYGSPPNLQEPRRQDPVRPGKTLNPRDNLVTLIAITTGEEAFDDANNNGVWDQGEIFEDTTEPFVDSDDSGTWELGERYVDTSGNGKWDGWNGKFDRSTLIWVSERILWTGMPNLKDTQGAEPVMRMIRPSPPPALTHFGFDDALFLLADPWFNTMAQNGEGDGCETVSLEEKPLVVMSPSKTGNGILFTYPSPMVIGFRLKDAHDPTASPPDLPFPSPVQFFMPLMCNTTASPLEGHQIKLSIGTIMGTVL